MKKSKASEYRHIESFADLRKKKKELDHEIVKTGSKVTSATEHLIDEGVKVVAVGVAGFLISRILGTFMSTQKSNQHAKAQASAQAFDHVNDEAGNKTESTTGKNTGSQEGASTENQNGESKLDTALVWLDTISGGIDAARIVLNAVAEKTQQAEPERSTEETETG